MTITQALEVLELAAPISREQLDNACQEGLHVWSAGHIEGNAQLMAKAKTKIAQIEAAYAVLQVVPDDDFPFQDVGADAHSWQEAHLENARSTRAARARATTSGWGSISELRRNPVARILIVVAVLAPLVIFMGVNQSYTPQAPAVPASQQAFSDKMLARHNRLQSLKTMAEVGLPNSQYDYGLLLETGRELTQDIPAACQWYRRAADQNYGPAQTKMGIATLHGQGAPADANAAAEWFRKAARNGEAEGQFQLGLASQAGRGVAKDLVQTHVWWSLAEAQGHAQAHASLPELEKNLSSADLAASRQQFLALSPPPRSQPVPAAATGNASAPTPAATAPLPRQPEEDLVHLPSDSRPFSGFVMTDTLKNRGGTGKLILKNFHEEDALVKMVELSSTGSGSLALSCYLRGGQNATFDHVPAGTYRLLYSTGYGWNSLLRSFTRGSRVARHEKDITFATETDAQGNTYSQVLTITLYKAPAGNTQAPNNAPDEFNRY